MNQRKIFFLGFLVAICSLSLALAESKHSLLELKPFRAPGPSPLSGSANRDNRDYKKLERVETEKTLNPKIEGKARAFTGTRQPGLDPSELDIVRTPSGKLKIRNLDSQSKYALKIRQNQEFDSWDEIWEILEE